MTPDKKANDLSYNLYKPAQWEYVMMELQSATKRALIDDDNGNSMDELVTDELVDQVLDMPPPWFPSLIIDRDNFANL